MPALSYDLHVHPGPSAAPRWGDGVRVWRAAADAGVRGFVWKAHEEHTVDRCRALPAGGPRAIPSASLNPWASLESVAEALDGGALWLWGPTQDGAGAPGWELPLPDGWPRLAERLATLRRPLVLATGHLGPAGRAAFAELAAACDHLVCSVTHALYVPLEEASRLAERGCAFEVDAYTLVHDLPGRARGDLVSHLEALDAAGALVYFASDGGQAATGDPFAFGAAVLDRVAALVGEARARALGVDAPEAFLRRVEGAAA